MPKVYVGDAIYAEIRDDDPGLLILTTEDGIRATNRIIFEPREFTQLLILMRELDIGERFLGNGRHR